MGRQGGGVAQLRLQLQWDYLKQLLAESEEAACFEAAARAFMGEALPVNEKNPVLEELNRVNAGV